MIVSEADSWWQYVSQLGFNLRLLRLCDAGCATHDDASTYTRHIAREIIISRNLLLAAGRSSQLALIELFSVDRKPSVTASECVTKRVVKIVN